MPERLAPAQRRQARSSEQGEGPDIDREKIRVPSPNATSLSAESSPERSLLSSASAARSWLVLRVEPVRGSYPQLCSRLVLDIESAPNYVGRVSLRGRDNLIPMKVLDILKFAF